VIHLDTSFLILALAKGTSEAKALRRWLAQSEPLTMSAIAWGEFLCGPVEGDAVELARRIVGEPIAFTAKHATEAAGIFNASGRKRGSFADCMIGAVAIAAGARLATSNLADFRRLHHPGLVIALTSD
jgi:predicted nucleic acid-binding protein